MQLSYILRLAFLLSRVPIVHINCLSFYCCIWMDHSLFIHVANEWTFELFTALGYYE